MTLLEEKHCDVLMTNGLSYVELSKECAKITLQHCIEVVQDIMYDFDNGSIGLQNSHNKIAQLQQQISELDKQL